MLNGKAKNVVKIIENFKIFQKCSSGMKIILFVNFEVKVEFIYFFLFRPLIPILVAYSIKHRQLSINKSLDWSNWDNKNQRSKHAPEN